MLIKRRIPIVLALTAAGVALMATALTASARPLAQTRTYPGAAPCHTTLQACIDGSAVGDQINLAPGTYVTGVTLNKSVSLVGAGTGATRLQALAGQRALTVTGVVTSGAMIANLTIQGGVLAAGNGAGVLVQSPAQPALQNLVVQSGTVNAAGAFGGGLYTESSLTLTNVTFLRNTAFAGHGGGLAGDADAHLHLVNVTFDTNAANANGGGLWANSAVITGSTFTSNTTGAPGNGGGAYLADTVTLTNSLFSGNRAHELGGGLFVAGPAHLSGGTFRSNESQNENGGALAAGSLTLHGTVITASLSFDSGGALFVNGPTTIHNALIAQNRSTNGAGGGLRTTGSAHISGTQFISNTSFNQGGGLRVNGSLVLTGTDFISNTAGFGGSFTQGGGLDAMSDAAITGGSFIANTTPSQGGGARVLGTLTLSGTLFANNVTGQEGGGLHVVAATVQNAIFDQNRVIAGNGGGLAASSSLSVTRTIFSQNGVISGTAVNSTGTGGGIFGDGVVTSTDNVFIGNYAYRLGGGMDADALVSVWDQFRGNGTGPQGSGGGLFVSGEFDLDGGLFFTNTANTAGGLGVNSSASGDVYNSLFARNVVTFSDGGSAMRLLSTNATFLTHNTIVGTSAPNRAAVVTANNGDHTFYNNIFSNHAQAIKQTGSAPTSTVTEDYNVFYSVTIPFVGPVLAGSQSFTATPGFINPAADDYRLAFDSPAIDSAYFFIGLDHDFEGQPRPMGNDWDRGFDEALPARLFVPLVLSD